MKRLSAMSLALTLAAVATGLLAAWGSRFGWWHFRTAFNLLGGVFVVAAVGAALGLVSLVLRRGRRAPAILAVAVGAGLAGYLLQLKHTAGSVPRIHDISTDLEDPPAFVDIAALRASAPNPVTWAGAEVAALQRAAYPDLRPVVLPLSPEGAMRRVRAAAADLGWEVVSAVAAERDAPGRFEATDTTLFFGFRDDIVVRLQVADGGTRIDVRSKSRVGQSDLGKNAARIRAFLDRIR